VDPREAAVCPVLMDPQDLRARVETLAQLDPSDLRVVKVTLDPLVCLVSVVCVAPVVFLDPLARLADMEIVVPLVLMAKPETRDLRVSRVFLVPWEYLVLRAS